MSNFELLTSLFLQIACILLACRVMGFLASRIGQPQVVGEILAGITLGPSLFGYWFPVTQQQLFPKLTVTVMYSVSHLGLVLYMFLMGLEFRFKLIRPKLKCAAWVSFAGIAAPFALGGALAAGMVTDDRFFAQSVSVSIAMLFLGAAMSVTAFPVLARIIEERGLAHTSLGALSLAAGSINDAVAWAILALALASFNETPATALYVVGGGVIYTSTVLFLGRPLLARLGTICERQDNVSSGILSLVLMLLMLSAWVTNVIGIYEVFGAFILGVAMPRGVLARDLRQILQPLTMCLLLPLFFVHTGLNTRVGLIDTASLWLVTLLILLAACLGKGLACGYAARWNGESTRNATAIGALMNARGLMELILLNIGLERGIITPTLFTMMVIMAIATTLMAAPICDLVHVRCWRHPKGVDLESVGYLPDSSEFGAVVAGMAGRHADLELIGGQSPVRR